MTPLDNSRIVFSQELADAICERMSTGESLRSVCRSEGMPSESTVRMWAAQDREGFAAQYAHAREAQMDALAEDLVEIADDTGKTGEDVQRSRLRVDARKWIMSKIAPKQYGDKLQIDQHVTIEKMSDEELDAEYEGILIDMQVAIQRLESAVDDVIGEDIPGETCAPTH